MLLFTVRSKDTVTRTAFFLFFGERRPAGLELSLILDMVLQVSRKAVVAA